MVKNFLSSVEITAAYNRCDEESKILLVVWIESVIMMIFEIPDIMVAWLIPYLMANNSASVDVMFTMWWIVLMMDLLCT